MDDRIDCEARLENLPRMLEFVTGCARQCGLGAEKIHRLELAAEEALVNICRYAYTGPGAMVRLAGTCRSGMLVLEISDEGKAFNPLQTADPDLELGLEQRKIGGLGIFMLRNLVDRVCYRRRQGRNLLTIEVSG